MLDSHTNAAKGPANDGFADTFPDLDLDLDLELERAKFGDAMLSLSSSSDIDQLDQLTFFEATDAVLAELQAPLDMPLLAPELGAVQMPSDNTFAVTNLGADFEARSKYGANSGAALAGEQVPPDMPLLRFELGAVQMPADNTFAWTNLGAHFEARSEYSANSEAAVAGVQVPPDIPLLPLEIGAVQMPNQMQPDTNSAMTNLGALPGARSEYGANSEAEAAAPSHAGAANPPPEGPNETPPSSPQPQTQPASSFTCEQPPATVDSLLFLFQQLKWQAESLMFNQECAKQKRMLGDQPVSTIKGLAVFLKTIRDDVLCTKPAPRKGLKVERRQCLEEEIYSAAEMDTDDEDDSDDEADDAESEYDDDDGTEEGAGKKEEDNDEEVDISDDSAME